MNIVALESFSPAALALLAANGHHVSLDPAHAIEADVLLVRSHIKVTKQFLAPLKNLKLIVSATSGFNHIDWQAARAQNVMVTHTPDANTQSAAELTMLLMLAWSRKFTSGVYNVRQHKWRKNLLRGESLEGKSIGIIGLGKVGSKVAHLAQAFGMSVVAHDPYISAERFEKHNAERLGLMELLKSADFVSLHVPLTSETKHLINYPTLREMMPSTVLVNTSRGPVVDESEVVVALNENVIAGALLDVLEREPPQNDSKLLTHQKIILTPHIGAFTDQAWDKASREAAAKVIDFANGKSLGDTLPLDFPWFDKSLAPKD
jgi:D-3-phosphoglycerate dehydrogenase